MAGSNIKTLELAKKYFIEVLKLSFFQLHVPCFKPLRDEQIFYDKFFMTSILCEVYVCMHKNF